MSDFLFLSVHSFGVVLANPFSGSLHIIDYNTVSQNTDGYANSDGGGPTASIRGWRVCMWDMSDLFV